MATGIPWVDETINPIVGCSKASTGCTNCYAEGMARRLASMGTEGYDNVITNGKWNGGVSFVPSALEKPFHWKKPRTIFIGSMGDVFHESVKSQWLDTMMGMIALNGHHTFILLTKRAKRMHDYMHLTVHQPLPNLVLGVSAENQQAADERIPLLLKTPAAKRFISLEPMVGPVDLLPFLWQDMNHNIIPQSGRPSSLSGVILGGESGTKARRLSPQWVRSVRDQCDRGEVPFMFKQGDKGWPEHNGFPVLDGVIHTDLAWTTRKGRNVNIEVPHVGL